MNNGTSVNFGGKIFLFAIFSHENGNIWIRIWSAIRINAGSGSALNQCEFESLLFSFSCTWTHIFNRLMRLLGKFSVYLCKKGFCSAFTIVVYFTLHFILTIDIPVSHWCLSTVNLFLKFIFILFRMIFSISLKFDCTATFWELLSWLPNLSSVGVGVLGEGHFCFSKLCEYCQILLIFYSCFFLGNVRAETNPRRVAGAAGMATYNLVMVFCAEIQLLLLAVPLKYYFFRLFIAFKSGIAQEVCPVRQKP